MCPSRAIARSAHLSWRLGCRPACGDYQSFGDANAGANSGNESKLHRVQVSSNQGSSVAKGDLFLSIPHQFRIPLPFCPRIV